MQHRAPTGVKDGDEKPGGRVPHRRKSMTRPGVSRMVHLIHRAGGRQVLWSLRATSRPKRPESPKGAAVTDTLTVTDDRTGRTYTLPIQNGALRALDLRQIKVSADDFGLMSYDPAFMNTASCKSRITFIDGDRGILDYRGYPIEQIAEKASYLEVAYLLLHGELPARPEYDAWVDSITHHTVVHENVKDLMAGFRYDAHPMGMLASTVAALSTFYPEAKNVHDPLTRQHQIHRLIAKIPTLAAFAYRHSQGLPYVYPDNDLSYCGNFLQMMFRMGDRYEVDPVLERALDVLFILHADHEQNCSTSAMRAVGSSLADPYCTAAAAIGALYGPLHGGANEQVLRMLREIGTKDRVPAFVKEVKTSGGEVRLMGFGHRVYKNYDPRAKIIKEMADRVFAVTGPNPMLDIALELERIALQDEYFLSRRLYPNVDFYSGLIYQALKFPVDMFPVLFAIPRMSGWLAQWEEMLEDQEQKIARPRQLFLGSARRDFVPIEGRTKTAVPVAV
jgi:citrate synthase